MGKRVLGLTGQQFSFEPFAKSKSARAKHVQSLQILGTTSGDEEDVVVGVFNAKDDVVISLGSERFIASERADGSLGSGGGGDAIFVFVAGPTSSPRKRAKLSPQKQASPQKKKAATTLGAKRTPRARSQPRSKPRGNRCGKVLNPATRRWVLASGAVAKALHLAK